METPDKRTSAKAGLPPGTIVYIGKRKNVPLRISLVLYNADGLEFLVPENYDALVSALELAKGRKKWIDIVGVCQTDFLEKLGGYFGIHPLVLEDIANTEQRPKFEEYEKFFFMTVKELEYHPANMVLHERQISIVLGEDYVISFQEEESHLVSGLRERASGVYSRIREKGPDYLAYRIIDSVVDQYFDIIEKLGDNIEALEEKMILDSSGRPMRSFMRMKRLLSVLLHAVFPLRESLSRIEKRDSAIISQEVMPFFRDIYDHSVHIIESVENQRDILAGIMDVYLSYQNIKMNAVMKVLTIIATIFMPLSFVASIYGMNFRYFPELEWRYGYLFFWIVILTAVLLMLYYFKKKKWLS